ncbi:hypothetical protein PGT21_032252 [Puccinia graminis f. sp. tritici]|uniref:Uncharacterized protein n=1 Tax=Puccinia graminis f. sp. tritici TaxID=56615 RepID=A0A5B0PLL8_PUCGR|nr:hypothetical protein PGT21_032252 [Puccinia graminis f. sp. tritici]
MFELFDRPALDYPTRLNSHWPTSRELDLHLNALVSVIRLDSRNPPIFPSSSVSTRLLDDLLTLADLRIIWPRFSSVIISDIRLDAARAGPVYTSYPPINHLSIIHPAIDISTVLSLKKSLIVPRSSPIPLSATQSTRLKLAASPKGTLVNPEMSLLIVFKLGSSIILAHLIQVQTAFDQPSKEFNSRKMVYM